MFIHHRGHVLQSVVHWSKSSVYVQHSESGMYRFWGSCATWYSQQIHLKKSITAAGYWRTEVHHPDHAVNVTLSFNLPLVSWELVSFNPWRSGWCTAVLRCLAAAISWRCILWESCAKNSECIYIWINRCGKGILLHFSWTQESNMTKGHSHCIEIWSVPK